MSETDAERVKRMIDANPDLAKIFLSEQTKLERGAKLEILRNRRDEIFGELFEIYVDFHELEFKDEKTLQRLVEKLNEAEIPHGLSLKKARAKKKTNGKAADGAASSSSESRFVTQVPFGKVLARTTKAATLLNCLFAGQTLKEATMTAYECSEAEVNSNSSSAKYAWVPYGNPPNNVWFHDASSDKMIMLRTEQDAKEYTIDQEMLKLTKDELYTYLMAQGTLVYVVGQADSPKLPAIPEPAIPYAGDTTQ